ncbi:hypothetical protein WME89_40110 [Sorangium sp. So ce321]|uniref:hypothetical protein n=1 Tax=Sorangium sp. So ce321 TaxID=3133300 RepID=UPI003F5F5A09
MNRLTRFGALSAFLSLVLWGGKDVAAAPIPADVSSKQLKDLTTADVESTCQSLAPSLSLSKEDTCEFAGILWSTVGQECNTVKEKCMAEADPPATQPDDAAAAPASCLPPAEARTGCTATVAEYEACLLAHVTRLRALTCASTASTIESPVQECALITQKCPDLAGGDDDDGQGADQP